MADPCQGDPAAQKLSESISHRDWRAARDFLTAVVDADDRAFYVDICANVNGVQDWIEQWIAAEPNSALPLLVRGAHGVRWAWKARGAPTAGYTSQEQLGEFFRRLKMAESCLEAAIERDPADSTAWSYLVAAGRGRQVERAEAERRFAGAVAKQPWHLAAHMSMLQYLSKKWCGGHDEMFAFAREAAANSPAGSPLGVLVAEAHIEYWLDISSGEDAKYMSRPEVVAELNAAAERSVRHPDYHRRPGWPAIHNTFAFAFVCAGDFRSAADQFDTIGDLVAEHPWRNFRNDGDGVAAYQDLRERAYRSRRPTG